MQSRATAAIDILVEDFLTSPTLMSHMVQIRQTSPDITFLSLKKVSLKADLSRTVLFLWRHT